MKGGRVEGEKMMENYKLQNTNYKQITNHKLQITNKGKQYPIVKKPSGPKGLIGPPCHGAPGRRRY
jgi:hypothetical protein